MENQILRVTFGETNYFTKVLKYSPKGFEIITLFPVEGIKYTETSSENFEIVSYFEERVLKAYKEKLIFEIEIVRNLQVIKQKLRELEFSLSIFLDDEQSSEKQQRIRRIFGESFFKDNFPFFEFTDAMVNYLLEYLEFRKEDMTQGKHVIAGSEELFLESFDKKTIHCITNNK
ncbi:hypothetical protein [Kaistella jeonii]|uniref:Uncharacterized protein n=1 Tax=Kaistella jeonii TaxID=266749 RepID=A0A0C1F9S2_9FLAO|nr:hypothetical protein [Kaistella jeonii]KIA89907.1 hypothetical protein OA86_04650 [Kaistella jeonii]SFB81398.1 hypothetical protein SAMN05421876_102366 [Kaistella jeonii]VEI96150.1 Uncharacterised protein [Kaistella jeonii]